VQGGNESVTRQPPVLLTPRQGIADFFQKQLRPGERFQARVGRPFFFPTKARSIPSAISYNLRDRNPNLFVACTAPTRI
jgi:anthranilate/para-aminobenzoate synthase component I